MFLNYWMEKGLTTFRDPLPWREVLEKGQHWNEAIKEISRIAYGLGRRTCASMESHRLAHFNDMIQNRCSSRLRSLATMFVITRMAMIFSTPKILQIWYLLKKENLMYSGRWNETNKK